MAKLKAPGPTIHFPNLPDKGCEHHRPSCFTRPYSDCLHDMDPGAPASGAPAEQGPGGEPGDCGLVWADGRPGGGHPRRAGADRRPPWRPGAHGLPARVHGAAAPAGEEVSRRRRRPQEALVEPRNTQLLVDAVDRFWAGFRKPAPPVSPADRKSFPWKRRPQSGRGWR